MDPIRIDEVLAELDRLSAAAPEGFTRRDVELHFDIAERSAAQKLRAWVRAGRVAHVGYREGRSIDGKGYRIPVYRLAKPN